MVQYEYVGRLSARSLVCISVIERPDARTWDVSAELLLIPPRCGIPGKIELARGSYKDPLAAAEQALALSWALERETRHREGA